MTSCPTYHIQQAITAEEKAQALQIRFKVFVEEQQVSPEAEADDLDAVAHHWVVRNDRGDMVATARLTDLGDGVGQVGRVAVLKSERGRGIGKILMEQIEQDARQMGFNRLILHGQVQCQTFYEKLGYDVTDPIAFMEENILHVHMAKGLTV